MKTTIKIADLNSTGIAYQAKLDGITEVTHIGSNHKSGDQRCEMYDVGGVRVMTTNGDPIWEEQDAIAFAEHMEWAGVELFADVPSAKDEKWHVLNTGRSPDTYSIWSTHRSEAAAIRRVRAMGRNCAEGHTVAVPASKLSSYKMEPR